MVFVLQLSMRMGIPWRAMLRDMTGQDLAAYMALMEEFPPDEPADMRMATTCAAIYRAAGSKTAKPQHFMPKRKKRRVFQSVKEQISAFKKLTKGAPDGK